MKANKILIIIVVLSLIFRFFQWKNETTYKNILQHEINVKISKIYTISEGQSRKIKEVSEQGYILEKDIPDMMYEAHQLYVSLLDLRDYASIFGTELYSNFEQYEIYTEISNILLEKDVVGQGQDEKILISEKDGETLKLIMKRLNYIIGVLEAYSYPENETGIDMMKNWIKITKDLSKFSLY